MQLIKNIKVSHCTNHASSIKAPVADIKVFEVVWWLVHHFCISFKNPFFKSWFWEIKGKFVFVEETSLLVLKAKGFQVSSYPIFIDLQFDSQCYTDLMTILACDWIKIWTPNKVLSNILCHTNFEPKDKNKNFVLKKRVQSDLYEKASYIYLLQ